MPRSLSFPLLMAAALSATAVSCTTRALAQGGPFHAYSGYARAAIYSYSLHDSADGENSRFPHAIDI